jgi:hypothetical protein
MPKIPTIDKRYIPEGPMLSPGAVGKTAGIIRSGTEQMARAAQGLEKEIRGYFEREQKAKDALEATKLENNMRDLTDQIAESYQGRFDYENFDKDFENEIKKFDKLLPDNPRLQLGFERAKGHYVNRLGDVVRAKKYSVMGKEGQVEAIRMRDKMIDDYANADEKEKSLIVEEFKAKMNAIQGANFVDPVWIQAQISGFEGFARKAAQDNDDVEADKAIMADPKVAFVNLHDKGYLSNLLPKVRQDKIEKAQAAIKIWDNENERKAEEKIKLDHDNEERQIGNLFMANKYKDAYVLAQSSQLLSGDEKAEWKSRIESASKKEEVIDPTEETLEIAYVNQIIAKGVNPTKVIEDYIITSPRMGEQTKRKQIEKVEKYKNKEINRAKTVAYDYLRREIISPKGIAGIMSKFIPEDVRAKNYSNAQLALDDWVDQQMILENPISGTDVQKKAEEIVNSFRPKFNQRTPLIQKNTSDMIKGLGELGELSKGKATETKPKEEKPKQTKYKNAEEVREAYNRKELTWDDAIEIIKAQFGFK